MRRRVQAADEGELARAGRAAAGRGRPRGRLAAARGVRAGARGDGGGRAPLHADARGARSSRRCSSTTPGGPRGSRTATHAPPPSRAASRCSPWTSSSTGPPRTTRGSCSRIELAAASERVTQAAAPPVLEMPGGPCSSQTNGARSSWPTIGARKLSRRQTSSSQPASPSSIRTRLDQVPEVPQAVHVRPYARLGVARGGAVLEDETASRSIGDVEQELADGLIERLAGAARRRAGSVRRATSRSGWRGARGASRPPPRGPSRPRRSPRRPRCWRSASLARTPGGARGSPRA